MSNYNMLVGKKKIEYIAHNIIISNHAKNRMEKRLNKNKKTICKMILNSPMWYRNNDGTINIAINRYNYFVVSEKNNKYYLITIKEKSNNKYDITDKFVFAYAGLKREKD